jgi:co-chaperonin GroES (HSP10)
MIDIVYKDKVLLVNIPPPDEESGYIIPEGMEEQSLVAKVAFIGPKVMNTLVGDIVVYSQFAASELNIEGTSYILTVEEELICKLKENESN